MVPDTEKTMIRFLYKKKQSRGFSGLVTTNYWDGTLKQIKNNYHVIFCFVHSNARISSSFSISTKPKPQTFNQIHLRKIPVTVATGIS